MEMTAFHQELIKNFRTTFESKFSTIVDKIMESKEHSNMHTSLEEEKDKFIDKYDLLTSNAEKFPWVLDPEVLIVLIKKSSILSTNGSIKSIVDTYQKEYNLETTDQVIGLIEVNHESLLKVMSKASNVSNIEEYHALKESPEYYKANKKFFDETDMDAMTAHLLSRFEEFIKSLEEKDYEESVKVYRSISIDKPKVFLETILGLSQSDERPLGSSWSRSPKRAQSYEGDKTKFHVKIHGTIDLEAIDYLTTIVKNLSIAYGQFEEEMYLKSGENKMVRIEQVEVFSKDDELLMDFNLVELDKVVTKAL